MIKKCVEFSLTSFGTLKYDCALFSNYFLISNLKSNENNIIYFLFTNGKEEQMNFMSELFIPTSCSRLMSFVHHVVGDAKIRCSRKTVCANDIQRVYRFM